MTYKELVTQTFKFYLPPFNNINSYTNDLILQIKNIAINLELRQPPTNRKYKDKPWFDAECKLNRNKTRTFLKCYLRFKCDFYYNKYLTAKAQYNIVKKTKKRNYFKTERQLLVTHINNNIFWKIVNGYRNIPY